MYSIGWLVTTNNDGIRNAVLAIIPDINDPRVNVYDYRVVTDGVNIDGIKYTSGEVRFDLKTDRDDVLNSIKGISGIFNACDSPSYVRPHICNGDNAPCETIEPGGVYK